MPELPEVEYTRRLLQRAMAGQHIRHAIARRPSLRYPFPSGFSQRLEGTRVLAVRRRAKYLLVGLSSGDTLLVHLGMSGWFRVLRKGTAVESVLGPHDHVVFVMESGAAIVFTDPRRFGFMTLLRPDEVSAHAPLNRIGPEPLARRFDIAAFGRELRRRRTPLKIALSDQRVIAGLGNIYVSEALHRAALSPRRRASTLVTRAGQPTAALETLVAAIRDVLTDAIRHQYRAGADDPFLVYDREGGRCPRRGCRGTIRRIVQGGRSTFYCPLCQR